MQQSHAVFVYGTLRRGHGPHDVFLSEAKFVGEDTLTGELYDMGSYPGLKLYEPGTGGGRVHGEVYEVSPSTLPRLDNYEGYPYLYDRKEVMTEGGRRVLVYTYNDEEDMDESNLIHSGDWEKRQ